MAKQNVGFGERHLEKLVIGVAGAVLAAAIFLYGVRDPYHVEVAGETLSPAAFYAKLDEEMRQVVERLKNPPTPELPKWEEPKIGGKMPTDLPVVFVPINPPTPQLQPGIKPGGIVELVGILPPGSPALTTGRGVATLPAAQIRLVGEAQQPSSVISESPFEKDYQWITVFATVPRKAQQEAFMKARYAVERQQLIVLKVEAERQRQLASGVWEEPQAAVPWVSLVLSGRADVPLETHDGEPSIAEGYYHYITQIQEEARREQANILRPDFQSRLTYATDWKVPAEMPGGVTFKWLEDFHVTLPGPEPEKAKPAEAVRRVDYAKVKTQVNALLAGDSPTSENYTEAQRLLTEAINSRTLTQKDEADAQSFQRSIEVKLRGLLRDEQEAERLRQEAQTLSLGPDVDLAWVTDISAKPGETYRYRVRLLAVNPNAGLLSRFKKPEDAAKVILTGEWSKWSEPATLPPSEYLFLMSADANQGARIELHEWFDGEWKPPTRQNVTLGQPLSFNVHLQEFSYDGVVAGVDLSRPYEERTSDKSGIRYREAKPTAALVLVSADGDVEERFVARDFGVRREMLSELNKRRDTGTPLRAPAVSPLEREMPPRLGPMRERRGREEY
ncbi:MAG: hypothetical protein HY718_19555 [Planctomycetes bacterium]|nr:hypothetical protein [Planctomycetota bacterium]